LNNQSFDTIIVGAGLAGCNMAVNLHLAGEKVLLIGHPQGDRCSSIAAGLMNPIVPKGVRSTWQRDEIFESLPSYYKNLEQILNTSFFEQRDLFQLMANESTNLEWSKASELATNEGWVSRVNESCFRINNVYRLDVPLFVKASKDFFGNLELYIEEDFDYSQIVCADPISYKELKAKKILFCEGADMINNPFFNYLPLRQASGVIGEYRLKHGQHTDAIIRNKKWNIPTKNGTYLSGSTFSNNDYSIEPTEEEKEELENDLIKWTESFELLKLRKGLRPTSGDRRPILGNHQRYMNLFVFNGLGSKGCSLSAYLCPKLTQYMVADKPLPEEVHVKRFD